MPKITLQSTGQSVEGQKGQPLKQIIQDNGWAVPFACENGICGTCLIKIVSGGESLSPISEQEQMTLEAMGLNDGQHRLACQCEIGDKDLLISE